MNCVVQSSLTNLNKPQHPNIMLGKSMASMLPQWLSRNVVAGTGWLLMAAGRCSLPSWVPTGVTSTDSWRRNRLDLRRFIRYSSDPLKNRYAFNCQYNFYIISIYFLYNFYIISIGTVLIHGQITSNQRRTECANKSNKAKQHDIRCRTPFLHS